MVLGQISLVVLDFPLSVSFHRRTILIYDLEDKNRAIGSRNSETIVTHFRHEHEH